MREKEETLLWFIALDLSNRHFSTGRKDVKLWRGELVASCELRVARIKIRRDSILLKPRSGLIFVAVGFNPRSK